MGIDRVILFFKRIAEYKFILLGTFTVGGVIYWLIKLLIEDLIVNTLKKAGKPLLKRIRFLNYIKAHPALIPVILFFFVLIILTTIIFFDIRKPTEISTSIPTTMPSTPTPNSEQKIEKNINQLETYLNNGEHKSAFYELFTPRYRNIYGYTGFYNDTWYYLTNIELSAKEPPTVLSSSTEAEVTVLLKYYHRGDLEALIRDEWLLCYEKQYGEWLIDEIYKDSNRSCW